MEQPPVDEYSGLGGSYERDPETGKRRLLERTLPAEPPAAPPPVEPAEDTEPA